MRRVTATRVPQPSLEVPASVDRIYADEIRDGRPQVNLSESLGRVPGIVVQNRQNYAQDLQISSRGFGARATFGVRGIRLIADGIPATMPDGQGQAATFALGSAERIEVLRGPFSALYGNAAGGVIVVETEDPPAEPTVGRRRLRPAATTPGARARGSAPRGALNALLDASRFESDGYRDHSAVRRDHFNLKLQVRVAAGHLAHAGRQPAAPAGDAGSARPRRARSSRQNPRQATPQAITFNTRKTVYQEQLGGTLSAPARRATRGSRPRVYGGQRWVEQYLGIPPGQRRRRPRSGGVVQLDRGYGGGRAALFPHAWATCAFSLGAEHERMDRAPHAASSTTSACAGELRRDEDDEVSSTDFYAQAEWKFAERWSAHGGLRTSRVEFKSTDYFIVPGNPDDSGTRDYSATTPVAGLLFRASKNAEPLRQRRRAASRRRPSPSSRTRTRRRPGSTSRSKPRAARTPKLGVKAHPAAGARG